MARGIERSGTVAQLRLAGRYLLLGLLTISLLFAAALYLQFQHDRALVVARETTRLALVKNTLVRYLDAIADELSRLAAEPDVQAYLRSGSLESRQAAIREFYAFSKYKQRYAQVRLIAADGQEDIRVDLDGAYPRIIVGPALQNKRHRYYFSNALPLAAGQIYVSPLDLNVEHGEIERPYRAMIRFAMPLRDAKGGLRAVLVLNLNADNLLSRFDSAVASAAGRVELLNGDGYWLRGADRARDFGFMFEYGGSFAASHPERWSAVRGQDVGVVSDRHGTLLFSTVYPLSTETSVSGKNAGRLHGHERLRWKLVSDLPNALLARALWARYHWMYTAAWLLMALVVTIGSWVLAGTRLERRQMQRERLLHESVFAAASDAMMLTDLDGRILSVNAAFTRQTGYAPADVVGGRGRLLQSGRQDDAFYRDMWQELRQSGSWRGELWDRRKDGSLYLVWLRISAIKDGAGRVIAYAGLLSDVTAQHQAEERLREQAYRDHLTGLASRQLFRDRLDQALAAARRSGSGVALCYLDLDRFKPVNDGYGHAAGDHVLSVLSERMRAVMRDVDTVARIGGDEFAIILVCPEDERALAVVIERMQQALREPVTWQEQVLELDSSVGVALFPEDAADAEDLLHKADAAMYAAKRSEQAPRWRRYRQGMEADAEADAPAGDGKMRSGRRAR